MPLFPRSDTRYRNVHEFALQQGLDWDGYERFERILTTERRSVFVDSHPPIPDLLEHGLRFKEHRREKVVPVLYVAHPSAPISAPVATQIAEYAASLELHVRINEPGDVLREGGDRAAVVFWRPELHEIEAPLRLS